MATQISSKTAKQTEAVIQFMHITLEGAGYEIRECPHEPGWTWCNGSAECKAAMLTFNQAVLDAWRSASEYVKDILGVNISQRRWAQQWNEMSVGQQGKMILLCFDTENEEISLAEGLFKEIRENDLLKKTIKALGGAIEDGDTGAASLAWEQAKNQYFGPAAIH